MQRNGSSPFTQEKVREKPKNKVACLAKPMDGAGSVPAAKGGGTLLTCFGALLCRSTLHILNVLAAMPGSSGGRFLCSSAASASEPVSLGSSSFLVQVLGSDASVSILASGLRVQPSAFDESGQRYWAAPHTTSTHVPTNKNQQALLPLIGGCGHTRPLLGEAAPGSGKRVPRIPKIEPANSGL